MRARIACALFAALLWSAESRADGVLYFPKRDVDAAFAVGRPLTENARFKVHASRRTAPGMGEVHVADTDILYVLSGQATLVTGGALVAPKQIAPNELRGERIDGGSAREIGPGDVVIVPNGVPHWFSRVNGTITYYVVKATDAEVLR
jgi:mannose-6-phosphate isomerase-like protein (cupin superfamily)